MVGRYVEDLLLSLNLTPEDIPKAMGLFMVAKGAALATGMAVGLRYQPLRRLVLAKRLVVQSSPWVQQQRLRVLETFDRAKRYNGGQFVSPWARQRLRILEVLDGAKRYNISSATQRQRSRVLDTLEASKNQRSANRAMRGSVDAEHKAKAEVVHSSARHMKSSSSRDAKTRLQGAGQKLLLFKQISRAQEHARQARRSWRGWISKKYWHFADVVGTAAGKSSMLLMLSSRLGVMPKTLILGTTEGLLLAKLAVPLLAPLSLLLFVHVVKRPNNVAVTVAQTNRESETDAE